MDKVTTRCTVTFTVCLAIPLLLPLTLPHTFAVNDSFEYESDPSSTLLSSNPYGKSLELNCTIQVPPDHVRRDVNILWFKSPNISRQSSCQINIANPCSEGLGSRPQLDLSVNESFFSLALMIRNVTAADIGCYWCFSIFCLDNICNYVHPLGGPSKAFCLQPEGYYQTLFASTASISIPSMSSLHGDQSLTPSSSTSLPATLKDILPAPTVKPRSHSSPVSKGTVTFYSGLTSSQFSSFPSPSFTFVMTASPTLLEESDNKLATWLFVCLAVLCVILALTTCGLTAITICLGRHQLQRRCAPSNTVISKL